MELLKTPKARKKSSISKIITWSKMFRTPLLILFLLGATRCDESESVEGLTTSVPNSNSKIHSDFFSNNHFKRHRHNHVHPKFNDSVTNNNDLSEIKYLRRHLNKEIVNFVMTDVLVDGEVENRVHFKGISAKETYVGTEGLGLRLRQLTDGLHFVQVIYSANGEIQDCEFIADGKAARNFLKSLRKELKLALDEESYRLLRKSRNSIEEEKFYRHFGNVSIRLLKDGEELPTSVAHWMNYDRLKIECLQRHEQMKYVAENKDKMNDSALTRSRRSLRENFILPGTKWCGAGQLAEKYNELGLDKKEDKCCRAHDHCRVNIGGFQRRFGYFNFRPYTISHCRCDRRFRACLKLADTSVSNMVGKLFFNIVQTQCFILKPVKMCTKRSWWGKCLRRGYRKQAYLRNNLPY